MKSYQHPDDYFEDELPFREEVSALRPFLLAEGMLETIKWGQPCYTTDAGKNVCILGYRKAGAVLSFISGALLEDPDGLLTQPGDSRATRFLTFANLQEVEERAGVIQRMVHQAHQNALAGREVPKPAPEDTVWIAELQQVMDEDPAFQEAFLALTPGRQRGFNIHFGKPKGAKARFGRIEKARERIFMGKGIFDCVCGHSKRPPRCDGSHKHHR